MLTSQIELRSYCVESCSHTHNFAQIILPVIGSMELETGHHSVRVNDNTGVYIAPNERHCFAGSKDNLFLVVDVGAEDNYLNRKTIPHILDLTTSTRKFIQFAHYYLSHNERDLYTDSLVNQLLLSFSSKISASDSDNKVMKAKTWIDLHLTAPVNVAKVAEYCHLSSSQLQRRFKQDMGYSVAEYWRIKKIRQAEYLLTSSQLSIEEISCEIGYENLSAFSRRFRQVFEESPSQWRNKTLTAKKMREIDK